MAVKAGEADYGLAVGVEKLAGAGLLAGGSRQGRLRHVDAGGPLRRDRAGRRPHRHGDDARRVRADRAGVPLRAPVRRRAVRAVRPVSEKNHAHSTLNPLAAYTKRMSLEEIMDDVMIAYPNTRPMCSANCDGAAAAVVVSGSVLKTLSQEQQKRAVQDRRRRCSPRDPWEEACQSPARRQHAHPQRGATRPTSRPASAPTTSTSWSCTTASPPPSSCTTTTSCCARKVARSTSSSRAPRGATAPRR